ncbi:hypothetical protein ES706_01237 [subsurface metagenome]
MPVPVSFPEYSFFMGLLFDNMHRTCYYILFRLSNNIYITQKSNVAGINMRYRSLGVLIAIIAFGCASGISYIVLDHLYGAEECVYGAEPFAPETKPLDVLPVAVSIGAAMGVVIFAVWVGSRRIWGDATSTLLDHGLHDLTIGNVEIVGHMMEMREFTVPDLMRRVRVSRFTVWRLVQKMIRQGLVQETEKMGLTANGRGGRGKPSRVYRYIGAR